MIFIKRGISLVYSSYTHSRKKTATTTTVFIRNLNLMMAKVSASTYRPPGVHRNWDLRKYTVADLEKECNRSIAAIQKFENDVASTNTLSFQTVFQPLLECKRLYGGRGAIGSIFEGSYVAESEEFRAACVECKGKISEALLGLSMRKEVYDKLVKYREEVSGTENLSAEMKKCLDRLILDGKRNGLELDEEARKRMQDIKNEMSLLGLQFTKNLGEEKTVLQFSKNELLGMDQFFFSGLDKDPDTGKYILTLKYPHYIPVMKKCGVPETRRKMEAAFNSRCINENTEILKKLVTLREEQSTILGYPNHASYVQEILMAKNPSNVEKFIDDVLKRAKVIWEGEKAQMLALKEKECENFGYEFDGKINMWDFSRFLNMVIDQKFSLDQDKLKEYFPLEVVLEGMLKIYQNILSLTFTLIPDAEVWSDDVSVYEVKDSKTKEVLGYFYLDLFPREGKYGHACCVPAQQGCLNKNMEKEKAVTVLICNFPRPTPDSPSLLSHDEVETIFHEFGHAMHGICSRAETPLYFGTNVQSDFLEAPSQMLENWCYEKDPLLLMSKHYKTGEKLPDDILNNLMKSKQADGGAMTIRQLSLATVDQRMHREGRYDLLQMYKDTVKEFLGLEVTPGTNMLASFSHLADGYDARYYVYMWSLVFGADMFETVFQNEGVLNPEAGGKYRKCILEPGGSLDGMEVLKNFLGREPSLEPFLRSKGLL